jgi:site-specific recombinase XerD
MASLYKRARSPYYWIKYRDDVNQVQQESTGFRHGIPSETRKAQMVKNEKSLQELQINKHTVDESWDLWVGEFLNSRYSKSPQTLKRYQNAWTNLATYLRDKAISRPRQLTYRQCEEYMEWRKAGNIPLGIYKCSHNNSRWELKILHRIMVQAIKRGYSTSNPCASLGIAKETPREKPELSDDDIALIRKQLQTLNKPEWMRVCFEIAIHQGCRLRETSLPLSKVDLEKRTIQFHAKGGKDFTAPIHPNLIPKFEGMKQTGQKLTCELPAMPSKHWFTFFKQIGLHKKGVCFHCTRVTVITRLIREGVPENKVKKIVNHASTEVHRIYQRLGVEDVRASLDALVV